MSRAFGPPLPRQPKSHYRKVPSAHPPLSRSLQRCSLRPHGGGAEPSSAPPGPAPHPQAERVTACGTETGCPRGSPTASLRGVGSRSRDRPLPGQPLSGPRCQTGSAHLAGTDPALLGRSARTAGPTRREKKRQERYHTTTSSSMELTFESVAMTRLEPRTQYMLRSGFCPHQSEGAQVQISKACSWRNLPDKEPLQAQMKKKKLWSGRWAVDKKRI
ncbi:uncharacterized protein LOC132542581 [Erinaceus europaeus]|uniref:Uncharacterized protein LOC132542581 n=1 Tax=Erinaceus europaeus TaxID=9365 RepID=A0ABM3YJ18_ERIEU|nr:uncharacterized protein LOC132542581 [Erinaceus europaeus]